MNDLCAGTMIGKRPGTSSVLRIDYNRAIQNVDDLLAPPESDEYVAPGFIDLQVNGFAGVDFNDPETPRDALVHAARRMAETGVTRCYPTVITGPFERMRGALSNLAEAKAQWKQRTLPEAEIFHGFHLEGPYLSSEDGPRGVHPKAHVRPPDIAEFERFQQAAGSEIRIVTIAPEWPEASSFIRHVTRSGVVASIGHTNANADQIAAAIEAGATMSTHLGNGAHGVLPKTDNVLWLQLAQDRLNAGFIADGIHVPAAFLKSALRAKGLERSFLVTDAVMPALCAPGVYRLGEMEVELLPDDRVVLPGSSRLAGSSLHLDCALTVVMKMAGLTLAEAVSLVSTHAARAGRLGGRMRGLTPGEKADLVRFRVEPDTNAITVMETVVAGHRVYLR